MSRGTSRGDRQPKHGNSYDLVKSLCVREGVKRLGNEHRRQQIAATTGDRDPGGYGPRTVPDQKREQLPPQRVLRNGCVILQVSRVSDGAPHPRPADLTGGVWSG